MEASARRLSLTVSLVRLNSWREGELLQLS